MRKKIVCVFFAVMLFLLSAVCAVHSEERTGGFVLFAQRYGEIDSLSPTGFRWGTLGGAAALTLDDALYISVSDDRKAYLLLPDLPNGEAWVDTYTVEISFRFTEIAAENGYFGFLMTGQGDAPLNRTEVLFRANGVLNGIGSFSEEFTAAMASGETVSARIFVLHGMMYEVRALCGGIEEILPLSAVKTIGEGCRGFVLRNASAAVESVEIVCGVDYTEKSGPYAEESFWMDGGEAPVTGENPFAVVCAAFAAVCVVQCARRARRRV